MYHPAVFLVYGENQKNLFRGQLSSVTGRELWALTAMYAIFSRGRADQRLALSSICVYGRAASVKD